jgi:hypothetical protein
MGAGDERQSSSLLDFKVGLSAHWWLEIGVRDVFFYLPGERQR